MTHRLRRMGLIGFRGRTESRAGVGSTLDAACHWGTGPEERMRTFIAWLAAGLLVTAAISPEAAAQGRRSVRDPDAAVRARIEAALDAAESSGDMAAAAAATRAIFDEVIAFGAQPEGPTLREAALAARMTRMLAAEGEFDRPSLLGFLRASPRLAGDLFFLIDEEAEQPGRVLATLHAVRSGREKDLEEHSAFAAAVCVVHDEPLVRRFNENVVRSPDAAALLDFYLSNERRMYFGLADLPPELLVHVADVTLTREELDWAIGRYAQHNDVGGLFHTIRYDYESLLAAREKAVTKAGYTLENIHRHGGVCADQAYFAVMVGKAVGVPSAYVTARAAGAGHAWVGFVQRTGRGASWNFSTGRYDAYKGLKGEVIDPQSGERTNDCDMALAAGLMRHTREERQEAAAYADAAARLLEVMASSEPWPPAREAGAGDASRPRGRGAARTRGAGAERADASAALSLLERSIDACPSHLRSWRLVGRVAQQAGGLDAKQRREWSDRIQRLCGADFPDFTVSAMTPLIESVEDPREQDRMWSSLLRLCNQRPDLSAEIRTTQGMVWMDAGEDELALECFRDVLNRHTDDGPFVLEALALADLVLSREGRDEEAVRLHQTTWGRCDKPEISAYYRAGSNWFQVGARYAERLERAGRTDEARRVVESLAR